MTFSLSEITPQNAAPFSDGLVAASGTEGAMVALMLDNSPDCLTLLERDGRIHSVNGACVVLLELDDTAAIKGRDWAELWPVETRAVVQASAEAARHGDLTRFSAFGPTVKGTPKWWDVVVAPVRGADGKPAQILCAARDMTELKQSELALKEALEAKEALLYEVNHRVKNSLALVTSLLTLQASHAKEPRLKQTLDEARSRIGVVAQVHQRLYQTNRHNDVELGPFLCDIAADVVGVFDSEGRIALETDCAAEIVLGLDKAVPLALLVSELITNSLKYAFPEMATGVLRLEIRRKDDHIHLRICDNGRGLPDGFQVSGTGGLGMRIVGALTRQIRAQLSASNGPGACFDIIFPAEGKEKTGTAERSTAMP